MEQSPKQEPRYLDAVESILFEDRTDLTQHNYLDVVLKGIGPNIGLEEWKQLYDYAQENINDPGLKREALLEIAGTSITSINDVKSREPRFDSWGKRYASYKGVNQDNRWIFDQAKTVVQDTLTDIENADKEVVALTYGIVKELELALDPVRFPGDTRRYTDYYSRIFDREDTYGRPGEEEKQARQELAAMSVSHLDVIIANFPEVLADSDKECFEIYLDQLRFVPKSEVGDQIISTILEQIDEKTPDVIDLIFDLMSQAKEDDTKRIILDRALDITEKSSQEQHTTTQSVVVKHRRFGPDKTEEIEVSLPSPQESNLSRLAQGYMTDRYTVLLNSCDSLEMMQFYPEYVKRLIELHSPDEQQELWEALSVNVAGAAFNNGSFSAKRITKLNDKVDLFASIAPQEVVSRTKDTVKQRLSQSYAGQ